MTISIIAAAVVAATSPSSAADLAGRWEGALTVGEHHIRLVVRVAQGETGVQGVLDSPDQGVVGLSIADLSVSGGAVRFTVPSIGGGFEGALSADGELVSGLWTQGPASAPLILARVSNEAELAEQRPQDPIGTPSYRVEEVTFANEGAGISLAGTLTLPEGAGPFPVAVLISGSGPQDRDQSLFGHRPFLVLADYLTQRGIAVLRYDDRGVGGSGGDFDTAAVPDFVGDATAAVEYLAGRSEIDAHRIGLIGHSEGGIVAPLVLENDHRPGWMVLIAAPAVSGERLMAEQHLRLLLAAGLSEADALQANATQRAVLEAVARNAHDGAAAMGEVQSVLEAAGLPQDVAQEMAREVEAAWFRWLVAYDPAPVLARVDVPVLALYGELDLQVPSDLNAPAMRESAPASTVMVFDQLNHLMQTAQTGSPAEYQTIEETFSPEALSAIADWILSNAP